jgi:hypothetical protein
VESDVPLRRARSSALDEGGIREGGEVWMVDKAGSENLEVEAEPAS